MMVSNITLGSNVIVDISSSINNITVGDGVKISSGCNVFGSPLHVLILGANSYIGPNSFIQGYAASLFIGERVSIAQSVNIMTNSGPNASELMQRYFPIEQGPVKIGNDCWIGTNSVIMPNVFLGEFCVVAANSFVNKSFESFSVIGGNPARLLKKLDCSLVRSTDNF